MENPLCPPVAPDFALIETMLWLPQAGIVERARHMRRLARSARHFGITPIGVSAVLDQITADSALRLRLTVNAAGCAIVTTAAFQPMPPDARWRVAIHPERLSSSDPWLRHKTTQRALYDSARAALPQRIDEYLFLNTGGALCEGTITNIYLDFGDGVLLTPPRACGLLPGIGREVLIAARRARVQRLRLDDIAKAKALYVGNALRGLIQADLVPSSC